ncbi:MAG: hypothetical protein AMXMBFR34_28900 [Myxococcaceae bacterium]
MSEPTNVEQLAQEPEQDVKARKKAANQIIELVKSLDVELFHTPEDEAYATVLVDENWETWPIASDEFHSFLTRLYFEAEGGAPGSQALTDATNTLKAEARFRGECHPVHVRVAEKHDALFIDACDEAGNAIKVTPTGWEVVRDTPVKFRRPKGMQALPLPVRGGDINELRAFLNVPRLEHWMLVLAWLAAVFFARGPFTFLVLLGRQGSAKTTTARALRRLSDPNKADVRAQPRNEENLMVSARNGKMMIIDNISNIPVWLSDALCRLATGGGFATRELFTNLSEVIVEACQPVVLTGIDDSVSRSDLLDRCLLIELPPIDPALRRSEVEFWKTYSDAAPRLFGAVLDLLAGVLRHLPAARERMTTRPRMADFAERGVAVEMAMGWPAGAFMAAYEQNQASADDVAIESSFIGAFICELATRNWEGTPSELLKKLEQMFDSEGAAPRPNFNHVAPPAVKRQRPTGWPMTTKALKGQLMRILPNLVTRGVEVTFGQTSGSGSKKVVRIRTTGQQQQVPQAPAAIPAPVPFLPPAPIPAPTTTTSTPPPPLPFVVPAPAPFQVPPAAVPLPLPFQVPAAAAQGNHADKPELPNIPVPFLPGVK